ncbi:propanediol utilization protein [Tropicibacter sp. R15_0]|uniref:GHMP family kinase ATP-binding protein n=1 Tax=Tropicibacter sp. R15_0 TaxID=2821101 RepID=UPI001ADA7CFA|nr:propanediol utilization protein [Tropicibacter sp. R15_0]MBO9464665.1 propanediol utilization protein [Tropicibacter sp. R15_0]
MRAVFKPSGAKVTSVAGHFGELLQGRLGKDGPLVLVTLPCPSLAVHARAILAAQCYLFSAQRISDTVSARRFLNHLNSPAQFRFTLRADMPPGGGAGASTAALVALARLAGSTATPQDVAKACLAIEGATDPLMFSSPERLLWASRRAETVAQLPALPRFEVLGGFWGPCQRTKASDLNFADISDLVGVWKTLSPQSPVEELAELSSESARRNMALRSATRDPTPDLAKALGAAGCVIAHTGAARGFIFPRGGTPKHGTELLREAGLRQITMFRAGGAS